MKRITLLMVAFLGAISMNAQSDCANAEVITVAADASVTVSSTGVAGTAPTQICNGYNYTVADITAGAWYSYTNSGTQDLVVTVNGPVPTVATDYFPSFHIASGSCGSLTCVGGNIITQTANADDTFLAVAGETYYIIFDNLYANTGTGTTAAFDFTVTTDSNVPAVPGVATNPTPADQATDVTFYEIQDADGVTVTAVDFAWDAPTTGGTVDGYLFEMDTDPNFSTAIAGTFSSNTVTGLHTAGSDYFTANTTYYWKVTPMNVAGGSTPVVWEFTTGTLGIDDVTLAEVSLYPNPMQDQLNINLPASVELESATMFDLLGQQTVMNIGENNTLNTSNLASGVYILKLETNQGTMTKKVIKQ